MSINFEIYKDQDEYNTGISENILMNLLTNDPAFKEELLQKNYRGHWGKLEIHFHKHSLVVETEMVWCLMFAIHLQAIKAIKKGETYRNHFENATGEYMTFDYIDARTTGVRIRYYGIMRYEDENGEDVFVSRKDYMKQEIFVPKNEYMAEMLKCISRFIQYRELLAFNDPDDKFMQDFKKEVYALM
jgi:hypothetical protein